MRRLVVAEQLSLDGVMQAPGDPDEDRSGGFAHGGWHMPFFDDLAGELIAESMSRTEAFLFGRRTYDIMARYWPEAPDDDMFTAIMNKTQKYVASSTLEEPLGWENSTLLQGDVADAVATLKREDGGDLVVLGSGELVRHLVQHDLVDEFSLMIDPLVLGSGKRLFEPDGVRTHLRLVDCRPTTTGVIMATYEPERTTASAI